MSQNLETMSRIAMAAAIVDTYREQNDLSKEVDAILVRLEYSAYRAFELYPEVTKTDLKRIDNKIESVKKLSTLESPKSIITLIEVAMAIMDEPCRMSKDKRFSACHAIMSALKDLRFLLLGGKDGYMLSSKAAIRAAEVWDSVKI